MVLALFDFDGTITNKDSMGEFIKYAIGKRKYYLSLLILSPILFLYFLKIMPNDKSKERLFSYFFKGWSYKNFQKIADAFSENRIDQIIRQPALDRIRWHQEQDHKVVIVTASLENWIKKWTDKKNMQLIATKLEIKDNKISGHFATKNCYGAEKVRRIKNKYNLNNYKSIYSYGDSKGDQDMLSIADQKFYKSFA